MAAVAPPTKPPRGVKHQKETVSYTDEISFVIRQLVGKITFILLRLGGSLTSHPLRYSMFIALCCSAAESRFRHERRLVDTKGV
jgi:hypothetical protein